MKGCLVTVCASVSAEIMEATRDSLRNGLVKQPLFPPSEAALTEYSQEWAGRKVSGRAGPWLLR